MFYCLFGYINSNACLKWAHTNCIWSGHALKHTQKQQRLREVSERGFSGQFRSPPVSLWHYRNHRASKLSVWPHMANSNPACCGVMCEHTVTSVFIRFSLTQPTPLFFAMSSFFCGLQMAMSGFYWSIKGIFISFCISTVSALLISIRFLLTALEWKSPTKKGRNQYKDHRVYQAVILQMSINSCSTFSEHMNVFLYFCCCQIPWKDPASPYFWLSYLSVALISKPIGIRRISYKSCYKYLYLFHLKKGSRTYKYAGLMQKKKCLCLW